MSCETCRFWEKFPEDHEWPSNALVNPEHVYGRCRRFPMQYNMLSDDWCGEFERRMETAEP